MKRFGFVLLAVLLALAVSGVAGAQGPTLDKIKNSGVFTIGVRPASPPFSFINKQNERAGFSNDLAALVHKGIEQKLGKQIKLEMKETTPATRIPLLTSMSVDLITETMTDTRARRDSVDFSMTFFVTGDDFIIKKGTPIKSTKDIAGKRIGTQQGSTNERVLREKYTQAQLVTFPDQAAAFMALQQGKLDAYCNDAIQLYGLKYKASAPDQWEIVNDWISYEPYGMAMRKNDSDFRAVVNNALMEAIENGEYFKLYEKWFGAKSDVPYPMGQAFKTFLQYQVVPK
ncbi:MAG TPA: transporter substrate-binding domain-containing protein [Thermodesulfobacteriota bacterium]|nr:transporter substrate-binding domain-containing protein [Thermodesulfobacteriota bacterium]